jgi:hypothetical protein
VIQERLQYNMTNGLALTLLIGVAAFAIKTHNPIIDSIMWNND